MKMNETYINSGNKIRYYNFNIIKFINYIIIIYIVIIVWQLQNRLLKQIVKQK